MQEYGAVHGTVESWKAADGWGVLLTPDGLTVFCHFSHLDMPGYRSLEAGDSVTFDYYTPGQDGCDASVHTFARKTSDEKRLPRGGR